MSPVNHVSLITHNKLMCQLTVGGKYDLTVVLFAEKTNFKVFECGESINVTFLKTLALIGRRCSLLSMRRWSPSAEGVV